MTLADALATAPLVSQATEVTPASPVAIPAFIWPTRRREISGWTFHDPHNSGHIGLDIAAQMLDPIVAVADGEVIFAEWGGCYGNPAIVKHEGSRLSHMARASICRDVQKQASVLGL